MAHFGLVTPSSRCSTTAKRKSRTSSPIPRPAQPISTLPTPRCNNNSRSGRAIGRAYAGTGCFGQIEGVEIGAAAQHRVVGKLLHHLVRSAVDHLKHDRRRVAIEKRLMR